MHIAGILLLSLFFTGCNKVDDYRFVSLPAFQEDIAKTTLVVQSGHKDGITAVSFSPDGKYIVSGSFDKTIKLWDNKGNLIKTFNRDPYSISSLAFSPESTTIAAASNDGIELWNINGTLISSFKAHNNYISSLLFSHDGKYLISSSWDKTVKIWDIKGRIRLKETLSGHTDIVNDIAITTNNTYIASGSDDKTIKIRDFQGNEIKTIADKGFGEIKTLAFDDSGDTIAAGTDDGRLILLKADGRVIRSINAHSDIVGDLRFIDRSKKIISSSWDGTIKFWDLKGNLLKNLETGHNYYEHIAPNPGETLIASGSNDQLFKMWDLKNNQVTKIPDRIVTAFGTTISADNRLVLALCQNVGVQAWDIRNHNDISYPVGDSDYYRIAMSPNGAYIAAIFIDKTIKLWDTKGKLLQTFTGHTIESIMLRFSSNSKFVILSSVKFGTKFRNIDTSLETTVKGNSHLRTMIEMSPDGKSYLTSDNQELKRWNSNGEFIQSYKGHSGMIILADFSPDNRFIITGSTDNTVKLWNIKGKLRRTFTGFTKGLSKIEFSPHGNLFIVQEQTSGIKLFSTQGNLICEFGAGYSLPYTKSAFHPGGTYILLQADKGFALFTVKGSLLASFLDYPYGVNTLGFSPDGTYILATFADGIIKIWHTQSLKNINLLTFTSGEWLVYTDQNNFECSGKTEKYIMFRKGPEIVPVDRMKDDFYVDTLLWKYFNTSLHE